MPQHKKLILTISTCLTFLFIVIPIPNLLVVYLATNYLPVSRFGISTYAIVLLLVFAWISTAGRLYELLFRYIDRL